MSNSVDPKPNSVANSVATVPGRNGGRLLRGGKPGNRGGGTVSKDFRVLCGEAVHRLARPKAERVLEEQDPGPPDKPNHTWWAAAHYLAKYGQPEPPREIAAKVAAELTLRAVRE